MFTVQTITAATLHKGIFRELDVCFFKQFKNLFFPKWFNCIKVNSDIFFQEYFVGFCHFKQLTSKGPDRQILVAGAACFLLRCRYQNVQPN